MLRNESPRGRVQFLGNRLFTVLGQALPLGHGSRYDRFDAKWNGPGHWAARKDAERRPANQQLDQVAIDEGGYTRAFSGQIGADAQPDGPAR